MDAQVCHVGLDPTRAVMDSSIEPGRCSYVLSEIGLVDSFRVGLLKNCQKPRRVETLE